MTEERNFWKNRKQLYFLCQFCGAIKFRYDETDKIFCSFCGTGIMVPLIRDMTAEEKASADRIDDAFRVNREKYGN